MILKKRGQLTAAVLGSLLLASACSFGTSSTGSASKTLLVETTFEYGSFDPARASGGTTQQVLPSIYQTLLQLDEKDPTQLDPGLAQSYTASSDGLSVTFKLRQDVHFSDGTSMTSADVVFSLQRLQGIKGTGLVFVQNETFAAPDKYTVVVTSSKPNIYIASNFVQQQTGITNSKVVQANGGTATADADKTDGAEKYLNQHSAGSGPYTLVSQDSTSQIILQVDPNYWGAKPAYSKVIVSTVPAATQLLDVQKQQNIVALSLSPHDASTLDSSTLNIRSTPSLEVFDLMLNANPTVSAVTSNKLFRQAVKFGIDYQALLKIAGVGAVQATGILGAQPGTIPQDQAITRDVAKAKNLLAQSGVRNPTFTLDFPTDQSPSGISYSVLAQQIQANLKDVGITVNLAGTPAALLFPKWSGNKEEALLHAIGGVSYTASDLLFDVPDGLVAKWMGWKIGMDATEDDLLAQFSAASSVQAQAPIAAKLQAEMNDYAVFIPLFHAGLIMVTSKSVGGLYLNGLDVIRLWEFT
jgi:peptide/nickel transport system substrate-binding protein